MAYFSSISDCCAVILHFVRTLVLLASIFTNINVNIFVGASIQVGWMSRSVPFTHTNRRVEPRSDEHRLTRDATSLQSTQRHEDVPNEPLPDNNLPETPDTFSTGKPKSIPTYSSILRIHEEIMAADAETIRIQQATIESQQEIIRGQKEMVHQLLGLLEMQGD
ncbi:hypothetical protein DM02DRAFT_630433 [Periconia macrospinosa]|uniref:Uncharacterized protein n=1 Tax=Periconia macrospinosa TaxID=97972 RepID=A0A2V1DM48_9PLEO|nr:hypothetical protein DM02DRAFT_630433 [Periconia macrospinosa]